MGVLDVNSTKYHKLVAFYHHFTHFTYQIINLPIKTNPICKYGENGAILDVNSTILVIFSTIIVIFTTFYHFYHTFMQYFKVFCVFCSQILLHHHLHHMLLFSLHPLVLSLVVIKLPYLFSTILVPELSKGMGHHSYGEPA